MHGRRIKCPLLGLSAQAALDVAVDTRQHPSCTAHEDWHSHCMLPHSRAQARLLRTQMAYLEMWEVTRQQVLRKHVVQLCSRLDASRAAACMHGVGGNVHAHDRAVWSMRQDAGLPALLVCVLESSYMAICTDPGSHQPAQRRINQCVSLAVQA